MAPAMHVEYACQFDVHDEDGPAALQKVAGHVADWLRPLGVAADLTRGGRAESRGNAVTWSYDEDRRGRLVLEHVAPLDGDRLHAVTTVTVVAERTKARVIVTGGRRGLARAWRPPANPLPLPPIVAILADGLPLHVGPHAVRTTPDRVPAGGVTDLVERLTDPTRALPVVCVSTELRSGQALVDPDRLARELTALASVAVLPDDAAPRALSAAVGDYRSVYGGAARIYWPGFSTDADPRHHRYWRRDQLETPMDDLVVSLRDQLSGLVLLGVPTEARVAAHAEDPAPRRDPDEWTTLLEEENERLEDELAAARAELDRLRHRLDITSVAEAVERAAVDLAGDLVFLREAHDSAAESPYHSPARVYEALGALAEAARRYADDDLPGGFAAFFAERGLDFAQGVSPTARHRWPREYERTYAGTTVTLGPHLRFGTGPPRSHCRIYWHLDDDARVIVIGHVGKHLTDTNT